MSKWVRRMTALGASPSTRPRGYELSCPRTWYRSRRAGAARSLAQAAEQRRLLAANFAEDRAVSRAAERAVRGSRFLPATYPFRHAEHRQFLRDARRLTFEAATVRPLPA